METCVKCEYKWTDTKIGGFAQCQRCFVIGGRVLESQCIGYEDPKIVETRRKEQRKLENEKKKQATIAWLKLQGKL